MFGSAVVALVLIAAAVALAPIRLPGATQRPGRRAVHTPAAARCAAPPVLHPPLAGVVPGRPWGVSFARFRQAVDPHPQIVVRYPRFGARFSAASACLAARDGSVLLIQWDPRRVPVRDIAGGKWDRYVTGFAQIRAITAKPVLITETRAARGPQEVRQVGSLFAGVLHSPGVIGAIWFDENGREVWRLEGRPQAIAAFRAGTRSLQRAQHRPG